MKIIFSYIWSFHNKFAFGSNKRRKKQWLMIDRTEIRVNAAKVKTHHFSPSNRFSVSSLTGGHGLLAWMDGQINDYREGGSSESILHPADWTSVPHSSLMSTAWSSWEGLSFLEMTRSSETDSWLIYLSCRQGGVWYTDLCKRSKRGQLRVRAEALLGVIWARFSSPSLPSLCFTSSLLPTESELHTQLL